ncbi:Ribosomal protein S18 acetylase RimI [Psychrobacillus sp. OK028]|uniref:GNAT family N-acetyltransferase n=1 Tax=Psychrobacillus sp. OK028 TaxID=1884359 RepID=UPI0008906782|nr:GNAT family N-acetyltransferase [Psychrobacillus sp. OK028]SDN09927.1 Ribosomal protein S18 acetylase RimI [Psychrobacillus sp. OK028]
MLTTKQLKDIEALQKECEMHDNIQLKLNWDMLKNRSDGNYDFLLYAEEELIAFLGLYPFGTTVEVCGMVKPRERRKQHFSKLFEQAIAFVKLQGFHKILLNAPAGSEEGKAFLKSINAIYSLSEYQMKWEPKELKEVTGFYLRKAEQKDLPLRIQLNIESFGLDEKSALEVENRVDTEMDNSVYIIDVQDDSVGKIRVKVENDEAWIYGFCLLPHYRGKGIGRKVLQHIIKKYSLQGCSVHLEVETENAHALTLYESIGFQIVHAQDYYTYN